MANAADRPGEIAYRLPLHSPNRSSPGLSHRHAPSINDFNLDYTLPTAVSHLINHLLSPLTRLYPAQTLSALRLHLTSSITEHYEPTWDQTTPHHGSGARSLICNRDLGLPRILAEAAKEVGVSIPTWKAALARKSERDEEGLARGDEWEAWCDPGIVVWRYGGWEWEDVNNDPVKVVKEPFIVLWSSASSPKPPAPITHPSDINLNTTPARLSHAIPIRAPVALPAVFAIPPTPANPANPGIVPDQGRSDMPLLPAAAISRTSSPGDSISSYDSIASQGRSSGSRAPSRANHRGSDSTSSNTSSASENSGAQLLTPNSRAPSVGPPFEHEKNSKSLTPTGPTLRERSFTPPTPRDVSATPCSNAPSATPTPTVTPYDGGNVTVLGGGVKLGGISRPSSVMSLNRTPMDRSRSPSVSVASRALTSVVGPNGQTTSTRKTRTRRRIMPTYLGHLGQPGIPGPFVPAIQPGWQGVGVGMGPPPVPGMTRPLGSPRVSSV